MSYGEIARGLADLKIYPLDEDDLPGDGVDAPGPRALETSTEQDEEVWEGGDGTLATAQDNKRGTGTIRLGRNNPTALAVMKGGEAVTSGVDPDLIITHEESADPTENYFMVKGQSRSLDTAGSGYRKTLHKVKAGNLSERQELKQFNEPTIDITYQETKDKKFVTREWFKTREDIPTDLEEEVEP